VQIATEGALWGSIKAHGLLNGTVIVSDDAGQFQVGRHALCWVHAERLVHKLDTFSDQQRAILAMEAVMAAERALGNSPSDVSAQKIGYDIASLDANGEHLRFIEVKGRIVGADSVMVTRQEVITSLHEPDKFILAVVQVENGFAGEPRYVRRPFSQEPEFGITAI
jgi:hypothetical protein